VCMYKQLASVINLQPTPPTHTAPSSSLSSSLPPSSPAAAKGHIAFVGNLPFKSVNHLPDAQGRFIQKQVGREGGRAGGKDGREGGFKSSEGEREQGNGGKRDPCAYK